MAFVEREQLSVRMEDDRETAAALAAIDPHRTVIHVQSICRVIYCILLVVVSPPPTPAVGYSLWLVPSGTFEIDAIPENLYFTDETENARLP